MAVYRAGRGGRAVVLVSSLIICALALARLGQSFWSDEASSVWFSHLPLTRLLVALCDPHPPVYYLVLKAWRVVGESEAWLRAPSFFAAVLAIPLTYQFGLRFTARQQPGRTSSSLVNARTGGEGSGVAFAMLASLLLALYPLQSWYASEARMYAMAQFLGLLAGWLGLRLLTTPPGQQVRLRDLLAYWLAGTLALLTDYSALLPWGLMQLLWLTRGRPHARQWLGLQAGVLLPVVALLVVSNGLQALGQTYHAVILSTLAARLGLDFSPPAAQMLIRCTIVGLVLCLLALTVFRRYLESPLERPLVRLLVLGAWLALLVLGAVPRAFTLKRGLVVVLPYVVLVVACVLSRTRRTVRWVFVGLGLFSALVSVAAYQREPWRIVVADLVGEEIGGSEVVWVDELSVPAFDYYVRRSPPDLPALRWTPLHGQDLPRLPDLAPTAGESLWLVTAETPYRRLVALLPAAFYEQYELVGERHEIGIGVYQFRRRPLPVPGAAPPFIRTPMDEWGLLLPSPLASCDRE